jgi:adenylate cyclase
MGMERRLAAIFSTDVQGYSRLMGEDEAATVRTITASRELMAALIQELAGGVVAVLRVADMRRADAL